MRFLESMSCQDFNVPICGMSYLQYLLEMVWGGPLLGRTDFAMTGQTRGIKHYGFYPKLDVNPSFMVKSVEAPIVYSSEVRLKL